MIENYSLQYLLQNDIISEGEIRSRIEMYEKQHYLSMHTHKIWQGNDGRWCTYIPDPTKPKGRRSVKKRSLSDLEKIIVKFHKQGTDEPRFGNLFYAWLDEKHVYGEIKKQTYDRYICDYKRFFEGKEITSVFFRHITEEMLRKFIKESIRSHELTSKAYGNMRTIIYGVFRYAKEKGLTNISITHFIGDLPLSRKAFRQRIFLPEESVFTAEERGLIEEYIQHKQTPVNLGILLGFETGLRIGEISALKLSDFDLEASTVFVCRKETRRKDADGHTEYIIEDGTKGRDGARRIVITQRAINIVKLAAQTNPSCEYLFSSPKTGQRIHGTRFSIELTRICERLGIKKRSMHKARKTYATRLIDANVDKNIVVNQLGHTDISTTLKYYYFNDKTNDEAIKQVRYAMENH